VKVAKAVGWNDGAQPTAGDGLRVGALATKLDHPRWLYVLPNNDVLVAETNAPVRPEDGKGIKAWFVKRFMKKAGAAVPSANRITLLRDADGDGVAEVRSVFLDSLNSPFGMALVGNTLYIANTDAVVKVPYTTGDTRSSARPVRVTDLPGGPLNHHWTKNIVASADGTKLYASVGSNSNVRRKWNREGRRTRGDLGDRSRHRREARVRDGTSQSGRHGVGADDREVVDVSQ
jgi:glucose/arabinose dehydrogenase